MPPNKGQYPMACRLSCRCWCAATRPDGSSPVVIYVYVEDVDAVIARAVAARAKILLPVKNQFWGDRTARIIDPSGHVWTISTRIEKTSSTEREERWAKTVKS